MNNRLNDYLREIENRLRFLPGVDREAELTEIAAHLDALIAGKIAGGRSAPRPVYGTKLIGSSQKKEF